jgi:hypothetical protein
MKNYEGEHMKDKTPIYLLSIVGIVALVAVVYVLTGHSAQTTSTNAGNAISGNVVNDEVAPVDMRGVGRFLVGVVLIGSCVYMYKKWE